MSSFEELVKARAAKEAVIEKILGQLHDEMLLLQGLDATIKANCPHTSTATLYTWSRKEDCKSCVFFGAHKSCMVKAKACEECGVIS